MAGRLKTASWVLLALVGALTLLGSLASAQLALRSGPDQFGTDGPTLEEVTVSHPEVAPALHARRLTAASWAFGFSILFLFVVLGPYRAGERWAWWAILAAFALPAGLSLLRIPLIGTQLGAATSGIQLAIVVVALALDASRLRGSASA